MNLLLVSSLRFLFHLWLGSTGWPEVSHFARKDPPIRNILTESVGPNQDNTLVADHMVQRLADRARLRYGKPARNLLAGLMGYAAPIDCMEMLGLKLCMNSAGHDGIPRAPFCPFLPVQGC